MTSGIFSVPTPSNEPVRSYVPGSAERASLEAAYDKMIGETAEIPVVIGGKEIRTGNIEEITCPHDTSKVIARVHKAGERELLQAVDACKAASASWAGLPWEERAAVLLKAAEFLAGPLRDDVNAATMIAQSKTVHQAEIDAACELIDFWRFNAHFAQQLLAMQPGSNPGMWNRTDVRPLEGFVFAVSPFNFTSIGGNLPTAPALMGNVAIWKPSMTAALSNYRVFKILERAGLPPGVINFLPSPGPEVGVPALKHPDLAGIHFTGSTGTFNWMWKEVGQNIDRYRAYPRVVGETGGKDFIFVHKSANPAEVATAILRGSFEFQGQKCSAASRLYIPDNLWAPIRNAVREQLTSFTVGDIRDARNFMGAVIDERSFNKISGYVDLAQKDPTVEVISGGTYNREAGWFIQPTFLRSEDPGHALMTEEIFGPVMTAWVYPEAKYKEALEICDKSAQYALTGAIFATDREAIVQASASLRNAAGNFYINDKPTGAVVGQQPFGGARKSGTNDKAGSLLNLLRWVSPRTIKETFAPPTDWRYPFLARS